MLRLLNQPAVKAWAVTLVAAAALLALGWSLGRQGPSTQLRRARQEALALARRANRLAADSRSLEDRLARIQSSLRECRRSRRSAPGRSDRRSKSPNRAGGGVLTKGKASLVLGGRATVVLEAVSHKPRRAVLVVKVLGGKAGRAVLAPGSEVRFRVDGRLYGLLVRQIHSSSVSFAIIAR